LIKLDVSDCLNLTSLICHNNQLAELDVANNILLTRLTCNNNQLTVMDVSQNTLLHSFTCANNRLTELDISSNTALTGLTCSNNRLTKLNLPSSNELGFIWCDNNQFTKMDVSSVPMLIHFDCTYNNMQTTGDVSGWETTRLSIGSFTFFPQRGQTNAAPPQITRQPESLTVNQREAAHLTVEASGSGVLSYQWYERGLEVMDNYPISGATGASYDAPTNAISTRRYFCRVTNTDEHATGVKTAAVLTNIVTVQVNRDASGGKDITASFKDTNFLISVRNLLGIYDGPIYDSDLAGITALHVGYKNISDLAGIEHFADLTVLWCDGNTLTALDISKNSALTELYCQYNKLTELEVSIHTALRSLYCFNNSLKELDLSKNSALRTLYCNNNALTSLDISNNPNLALFRCQDNLLRELDVSSSPNLSTLTCQNNYLVAEDAIIGLAAVKSKLTTYTFFNQYPVIYLTAQPAVKTTVSEGSISGSLHITVAATQGGNVRYQWHSNTSPTNSGGAPIGGAVGASFSIPTGLTLGTYHYYCVASVTNPLGTASATSDVATVVVTDLPVVLAHVTGLVQTYYPTKPSSLELWREGATEPAYTTTSGNAKSGSGQAEQDFSFAGVEPGTYTLVVSKPAHADFIVHNIVVENQDVDLTADKRPEVQLMTLRCGDINGDGNINNSDLTILWQQANYNRSAEAADEPLCDLNGDGLINNIDLTILWLSYNYNRGAIEIQ
jgi:hypothetical protein